MGSTNFVRRRNQGLVARCAVAVALAYFGLGLAYPLAAQETPETPTTEQPPSPSGQEPATPGQESGVGLGDLPGTGTAAPVRWQTENEQLPFSLDREAHRFRRLGPDDQVWIDVKQKLVIAGAEVALERGLLEMFACPKGTKEHESVISVHSRSFIIHAGLLAVGAKPGHPVTFDPEYKSAHGQEIDVYVVWEEDGKTHWAKGQDWVIDQQKKEVMKTPWVFGGSGFWRDEQTGQRHYMAESGELICLSNFTTAMMDVPVKSSDSNAALLYESNADAVPNRGTKVTLVLVPKVAAEGNEEPKTEPHEDGGSQTDR